MITPVILQRLHFESSTTRALDVPSNSNPALYFAFAEADIAGGHGARSAVNAFSNAKRALHFQVEIIAGALGIAHAHGVNRRSFPPVLDFCRRCGIVTPRILRKLNRVRNAMEHEYYIPSEQEADDFVDIVQLFLAATDKHVRHFPRELELSERDESLHGAATIAIKATLVPGAGKLSITGSQLLCDREEVHKRAMREKAKLDSLVESAEADGTVVMTTETADELAYRRAVRALRDKVDDSYTVEDEDYYQLVSVLMSTHA